MKKGVNYMKESTKKITKKITGYSIDNSMKPPHDAKATGNAIPNCKQ